MQTGATGSLTSVRTQRWQAAFAFTSQMEETLTVESGESERPRRRSPLRWLLPLLFGAAMIAFGALNTTQTYVWPFGRAALYVVLVIPFLCGIIVGWWLRSRILIVRIRSKQQRGQSDV